MSEMDYINGQWIEKKKGASTMGDILGIVGMATIVYFTIKLMKAVTLGWLTLFEWAWKWIVKQHEKRLGGIYG